MKERTYYRLIYLILALGILGTFVHLAYIAYAYDRASIIEFIAKEPW